ncbi:hypothetical protein AS888_22635 [Peribacillus simplex]|uniref:Uncharacterized protein n=1 Tax=Peribacillus simplex TaxID=1478 RepID=A0A109MWM9_9BACI|nr:hypothetical protein AS888_22635 [Peribacillus simplex]
MREQRDRFSRREGLSLPFVKLSIGGEINQTSFGECNKGCENKKRRQFKDVRAPYNNYYEIIY